MTLIFNRGYPQSIVYYPAKYAEDPFDGCDCVAIVYTVYIIG